MTTKEYSHNANIWADDAMRFAVRLGIEREDAQDAVQDALLTLWQRVDQVEWHKGKSYLLSCTYNNVMHQFRRRRMAQDYVADNPPAAVQQAELHFDLHNALQRGLEALPVQQRAILQLRDVEGYSYKEIADMLNLSLDKVQVYLFRARVAMRRQMIQQGYGEDRR